MAGSNALSPSLRFSHPTLSLLPLLLLFMLSLLLLLLLLSLLPTSTPRLGGGFEDQTHQLFCRPAATRPANASYTLRHYTSLRTLGRDMARDMRGIDHSESGCGTPDPEIDHVHQVAHTDADDHELVRANSKDCGPRRNNGDRGARYTQTSHSPTPLDTPLRARDQDWPCPFPRTERYITEAHAARDGSLLENTAPGYPRRSGLRVGFHTVVGRCRSRIGAWVFAVLSMTRSAAASAVPPHHLARGGHGADAADPWNNTNNAPASDNAAGEPGSNPTSAKAGMVVAGILAGLTILGVIEALSGFRAARERRIHDMAYLCVAMLVSGAAHMVLEHAGGTEADVHAPLWIFWAGTHINFVVRGVLLLRQGHDGYLSPLLYVGAVAVLSQLVFSVAGEQTSRLYSTLFTLAVTVVHDTGLRALYGGLSGPSPIRCGRESGGSGGRAAEEGDVSV